LSRVSEIKKELKKKSNKKKAIFFKTFFKTKKGEYAEDDIFLGVTAREQRSISKRFNDLSFKDLLILLRSKIHEERLIKTQKTRSTTFI